ncbi:hypothetical protein GCM10010406_49070 [Streptomyces thermolineatus]|uniref:Barstar (barnase inhibitor) domain-containing protein n=1 Tax=Streptomyces thermolineatus TaxID=44033 RepID=A0ABP5ZXM9_9ACTN
MFWEVKSPWIQNISPEAKIPWREAFPPSGKWSTFRMDGSHMRTTQEIFEQYSKISGFPVYFGWNWDAFLECLRDFSWAPSKGYLFIIDHAERLLQEEPEEMQTFFSCIREAGRHWGESLSVVNDPEKGETPFNTILVCDHNHWEFLKSSLLPKG